MLWKAEGAYVPGRVRMRGNTSGFDQAGAGIYAGVLPLVLLLVSSSFERLLTPRVDDKTIQDYKLTPGSTIHLVLALRGGQ